MKPKIGIRPCIDGRRGGIRESLEEKTRAMAEAAARLISENCFYLDGTGVECVIADSSIGGSAEAYRASVKFAEHNVTATLTVTPCWCYGLETMDIDPVTTKAVWGFNGTERPGAVYLAAVMAAHGQLGLPAFAIYGRDVQDLADNSIPADVAEKIIRFAQCAMAAAQMKSKSYVNIGAVSMGIMGSYCDAKFFLKYLGMRPEYVDMCEVDRRIRLGIYDKQEYKIARSWVAENCPEGVDPNAPDKQHSAAEKEKDWDTTVKTALIIRDIMYGNKALAKRGFKEEAAGRNAIAAGFQGQRQWTDYMPNADFPESILNTTFDWNGKRAPITLATENDGLNGISMLIATLLTGRASVFCDVRTYWSPDAVKRKTGYSGHPNAPGGFIHLINSGAAALDGTGAAGKGEMKRWWEMTDEDIKKCLAATTWSPGNLDYFRGGGYSSRFSTCAEMPATMIRINIVDGVGPVIQIAEGQTVVLPKDVDTELWKITDNTWPSTWFAPRVTGENAFKDVYSVMANWGANHCALAYGHIGAQLITLAAMLRIPVSMHNVEDVFRPHSWAAFGTAESEQADFAACKAYGPLYK